MKNLSDGNKSILIAYNRGYRVDESGSVAGLKVSRLSTNLSKDGYLRYSIRGEDRKPLTIVVHRLQAYQKYGDKIFLTGIMVRHLNGNKLDNSFKNIAIGTNSDNQMDIPKEDRMKRSINGSTILRRFTDKQVEEIIEFHHNSKSYKETMIEFDISSKGSLWYILRNNYVTNK